MLLANAETVRWHQTLPVTECKYTASCASREAVARQARKCGVLAFKGLLALNGHRQ